LPFKVASKLIRPSSMPHRWRTARHRQGLELAKDMSNWRKWSTGSTPSSAYRVPLITVFGRAPTPGVCRNAKLRTSIRDCSDRS